MRLAILVCLLSLGLAFPAAAKLNEFSVSDGYQSPFSTRVWTYNSLWTLDGGTIDNNYVAQHGYGAGFPFAEPFALVIRNDNAANSYQFSYAFEAFDLAGVDPNSPGSAVVSIIFDICSVVSQNSSIDNGSEMFTMKFGGTRSNPAVTLGFSDGNKLMYSDAGGNLQIFGGYTLNPTGWDRITLTLDFGAGTYDLLMESLTGSSSAASNTWTTNAVYPVTSAMPFTNAVSSIPRLYFETFTDPEDGAGWHKLFLDNFDGRLESPVPVEASTWGEIKTRFQ